MKEKNKNAGLIVILKNKELNKQHFNFNLTNYYVDFLTQIHK